MRRIIVCVIAFSLVAFAGRSSDDCLDKVKDLQKQLEIEQHNAKEERDEAMEAYRKHQLEVELMTEYYEGKIDSLRKVIQELR